MSVDADGGRERVVSTFTRLLLAVVGAFGGYGLAGLLLARGVLTGPNNVLYLTLLGFLGGYLLSGPAARRAARGWIHARRALAAVPPEAVLAAGVGATVALLLTVLANSVLAAVPGFTWYWSLLIAVTLVTASSWFFVVNRRLLAFTSSTPREASPAPRELRSAGSRLIDTSAIIDGRIVDVIEANFLDGELLVPRFVLAEIQNIADSDDPLRRKRGRRGLEMLDRLVASSQVSTRVIDEDPNETEKVDQKLVRLSLQRGVGLITTDYNLSRVAAFEGVHVLNVNQLANAVKAMFLPGERLSLTVVKEGREPGQGLAYLEDGTMVVIEDAADRVGRTIETTVTSSLQTNMGRMIFARPEEPSGAGDAG